MTEIAELKSCPFCGFPPRTLQYNGTTQVTCSSPMTECAGFDVVAPVAMWNRRASETTREKGKPLGAFLKDRGIQQKDFAETIGVDPATVCRLVKGKQEPGAGIVSRIELATGGEVNAHSWALPVPSHPGMES